MGTIAKQNKASLFKDFIINVIGYNKDTTEQVKQLLHTTIEQMSTPLPLNNLFVKNIYFFVQCLINRLLFSFGNNQDVFISV